jgi:hypothetical protein
VTTNRGIAAAAMLAGFAVGTAGTAWADQTMTGVYKASWKSYTHTLTFTSCGDGCADVAWDSGSSSRATLADGTWTMDDPVMPNAVTCPDGSKAAGATHYSWDASTLRGEMWNNLPVGTCGIPEAGESHHNVFTLTKIG